MTLMEEFHFFKKFATYETSKFVISLTLLSVEMPLQRPILQLPKYSPPKRPYLVREASKDQLKSKFQITLSGRALLPTKKSYPDIPLCHELELVEGTFHQQRPKLQDPMC